MLYTCSTCRSIVKFLSRLIIKIWMNGVTRSVTSTLLHYFSHEWMIPFIWRYKPEFAESLTIWAQSRQTLTCCAASSAAPWNSAQMYKKWRSNQNMTFSSVWGLPWLAPRMYTVFSKRPSQTKTGPQQKLFKSMSAHNISSWEQTAMILLSVATCLCWKHRFHV